MLKVVSLLSTRLHLPCKVQKPPSNKKRNQRPQRPCHISVKLARSYRTTSDSFNRISTRFRTSSLSRSSKRLLRSCRNRANSGLIGKLKEYCHQSRPARELSLGLDQPCIMHTHIRVLIQSKRAMLSSLEAFRVAQQRELQPKRVAFSKKTKYVLISSHTANSSQQLSYLHQVT